MLFNLIKVWKGKRTVVMTGDRSKVRNRQAALKRDAHTIKKSRAEYVIEPAGDATVKFQKKPHNPRTGGGDAQVPRLTKWSRPT